MPEWGTYSLPDFLMFTERTYCRLSELHNRDLWPAHIAALAAGVALPFLLRRADIRSGRIVSALLAVAWLTVAWAYFWQRYATIHWAGRHIAALFVAQALWLAWVGVVRARLVFAPGTSLAWRSGFAVTAFAVLLQPLVGKALGRSWVQTEIFGLMPDPTVAATFGVVLATARVRWSLLVVPVLWSVFSGLTLRALGARDAFVLPLLVAASVVMAGLRHRRSRLQKK